MKIHFSSTITVALLLMLGTSSFVAATQIVPQADNEIAAAKKESLDHRSLATYRSYNQFGDTDSVCVQSTPERTNYFDRLDFYLEGDIGFEGMEDYQCDELCQANDPNGGLQGFELNQEKLDCRCLFIHGTVVCPESAFSCETDGSATGEINDVQFDDGYVCYKYDPLPVPTPAPTPQPTPPPQTTEGNGDPHFRTWKNEHFEFHGQCDLVMTKVENFANQAVNLEIHLRTKIVRYWSYIKSAAIRIGNAILEVEGSAEGVMEDGEDKRHYHINYEYRGPLTHVGGFPVTISPRNNKYTIDLGSKFPGQKIEINTFKEFVGIKIIGATEESFGKAVGITGNFVTGKTLARDGVTGIDDFTDLGMEWQVLPSDGKLFHEASRPQFPELCYLPEDPRGERTRRLDESTISEEAAEAACAGLVDEFDRKGCIYDILATQDLDMVGAY